MRFVLKSDGTKETFNQEKLKSSLLKAGSSIITAEEVVKEIDTWLIKPATTGAIYKKAFSLLRNKNEHGPALRYSLRRGIAELGPTGFPFEQFVAAILRKKGYSVETGKIVQGKCVDHEVDILAWNSKDLILGEVKFHSELGSKSDLKVSLYIDSRFRDLKDVLVDLPVGKRQMTDGLLITNTKFTEKAIKYANCAGVNLIGWNYPEKGNLHDLVLETGIHPITCLPSLSQLEKKNILDRKIASCIDLKDHEELFNEIPSLYDKKDLVMKDVYDICG